MLPRLKLQVIFKCLTANVEQLETLQPLWQKNSYKLYPVLCVCAFFHHWGYVTAVHSDSVVNDRTADRRQHFRCYSVVLRKGPALLFLLNASLPQCEQWFMSHSTNAGSSSCLGADIHPLIATICLSACVFLSVKCVRGHDKIGAGQL